MRSMTTRAIRAAAVGLAVLGSACSDDGLAPPEAADTGIPITGGATEEADEGVKLDVVGDGTMGVDDGMTLEGCRRVDVVFVVDNSSSMTEEHEALQGPVFDSFPQTLLSINGGIDDFQLAVIDACPKPAYFHDTGTGGACDFSTGTNFMSSSSAALTDEFACVSAFSMTGYMGMPDMCEDDGDLANDDEQPGLTAARSVTGEAIMDANAGFLRPDALLFVVTITDEDESLVDVGSVQEIYDQLVAAKGGDVGQIVYLGIAGGSSCDGPYGSAEDAVRIKELAGLFEAEGRGTFWDLCDGQLEVAFQTAIEGSVDAACQEFVPQG